MENDNAASAFEMASWEDLYNVTGVYTEEFFNGLVFNEERNVYVYTNEEHNGIVEVYFEYGILVYFKLNGNLMFGNVGSTVIEVPESYKLWTGINN